LPRAVGIEFPFAKLTRVHYWISLLGIVLLVMPLAIGGVVQGTKLQDPNIAFTETTKAMLPYLRVSTTGLLLMLLGNLLFFVNIIGLTLRWKFELFKKFIAFMGTPVETAEVKS
jgi:cbb3-type cytochrome oxidase subunit 1